MTKHACKDAQDNWNLTPPKPNVPMPEAVLYDERQAGVVLGCCPRTVRNLADRGLIPRVRYLSSVRYDRADLLAFIERAKETVNASEGGAA